MQILAMVGFVFGVFFAVNPEALAFGVTSCDNHFEEAVTPEQCCDASFNGCVNQVNCPVGKEKACARTVSLTEGNGCSVYCLDPKAKDVEQPAL